MIITFIALGMLVIGIVIVIIYQKKNNIYSDLDFIGGFITAIGILFFGSCIGIILLKGVGENYKIKENKMEYEALQKRIEIVHNEYEDVSRSDLVKDITEWNKMVYKEKYWAKSLWTNWFFNQKIADELEYINFEEVAK